MTEEMEIFRQKAEEYDLEPEDVEVVEDHPDGVNAITGIIESPIDGRVALSVPMHFPRSEFDQTFEGAVEFMMKWYSGESEHRSVEEAQK